MLLHALSLLWAFATFCRIAAQASAAANSSMYYGISGAQTGIDQYGRRPARHDILDLQKDPKSWALYVQALNLMMNEDETNYLSYFQIAGIHGRPWVAWNKAEQAPNAPTTGYCTHNSVLFLTWHRPYLALYEQVLSNHAQDLVQTYDSSVRASYQEAADALRIVYWDWATIPLMPDIISQPTISILTGAGMLNVSNPFYSYKFQRFPMESSLFPTDPSFAGDWFLARLNETVRGVGSVGGVGDLNLVNNYLSSSQLMRNTWLALVKSTTFNSFGTTATEGNSIEAIHNIVHGSIGVTYGHMSLLSYSAFDPIFWLHHANVDRLFAIWEAMNPLSRMAPMNEGYGTFAIPPGTSANDQTPLQPFTITSNGPWYDSTPSSRATKKFGYTYPGLNDWNRTVTEQQIDATVMVNSMYNFNNAFSKRVSRSRSTRSLQKRQKTREWFVGLSVAKFDLKGERFMILFYLSPNNIPAIPKPTDPNCIASFPVFPPPVPLTAAGNDGWPELKAWSEYSLDEALKKHHVNTQNVDVTTAYLTKYLQWVVTKFDGSVVPLEKVSSLRISVHDEIVTHPASPAQLPVYGEKTSHVSVTRGRLGGVD